MNDVIEGTSIPQLPAAGMDALMRAEIDIQISTAHAYPRKLSAVAKEVLDLATMSREAAQGCIYALPRDGKTITGPSIRLAEILFCSWGNCTGGSRVVEVNRQEGYIESEGVFHDLQKNAKTVRRFRRRITGKTGRLYSDDMIIVTGQAAGAIAFRNAVLAGIPRSIWGQAYEAAEQALRGDIKTLGERRDSALKAMQAFGFTADDVYLVLGIGGREEFTLDHIVTLTGIYNTIKDGEASKESLLRDIDADAKPRIESKQKPKPVAEPKSKPADPAPEKRRAAADPAPEVEANQKAGEQKDAPAKESPQQDEPQQDAESQDAPAQGELMAAEDQPSALRAPEPEQFIRLKDMIVRDMLDAGSVDEVVDMYREQIDQMKRAAPNAHLELVNEIDAFIAKEQGDATAEKGGDTSE